MGAYPTPHLEKLKAILDNEKLPVSDKKSVVKAIGVYHKWIKSLESVSASGPQAIREMVGLLNDYKIYIEVNLIFDSQNDFLYSRKGSLS